MLELLELQARARAIRSQLALEPVAKIELDSEDETKEESSKNSNEVGSTSNHHKDKSSVPSESPTIIVKHVESCEHERKVAIPPPTPPKIIPVQTKPLKLKRNYKTQSNDGTAPSTAVSTKEPSPSKTIEPEGNFPDNGDDDDVIRMERSPETFFISDSDDEPPAKKSPTKKEEPLVEESPKTPVDENLNEAEEEQKVEQELKENSPEPEPEKGNPQPRGSPSKIESNDNATDDDTVHLTSDTEIELHHQSDKEEDEVETAAETQEKSEKLEDLPKKSPEPQSNIQSDDDVVEINNSSDDEIMNDSEKSAGEMSKNLETWEQRWLSSSKTQSILKTTQLASKVRINMLKTKNTHKATLKQQQESEKAMKEKILNAEEGSMQQFKVLKENSN